MLDHLRMASRPRWLAFSLFAVILLATFLLLGRWQLSRASSQSIVDAAKASAVAADTTEVDSVLTTSPPAPDIEWRAVTARGVYDEEGQLLVRNRSLDSANGYWVVVPLITQSGPDLVVVRGWIPSGPSAAAPAAIPAVPSGPVEVTGRIRVPEPTGNSATLPEGQIERVIPQQIAELTGRPTYGGWLVLASEKPSPAPAAQLRQLPDAAAPSWRWPVSTRSTPFSGSSSR